MIEGKAEDQVQVAVRSDLEKLARGAARRIPIGSAPACGRSSDSLR
jgi:hypothetical protein